MPLYDFKCPSGHTFDAFAPHDATRNCPECGAEAERLIGAPGFVLKGNGYYDKGRGAAGKPAG